MGDGFLVEFASAVQAVSCAKAIQEANGAGRLLLPIGIHVGDVVVQGDDLMGDGVNVAARVEGVAEPGGIAITRAVHEQVRDKLDLGFMDKGEIELKYIQRPVQVFVIGRTNVDDQATALPLPRQTVDCRPAVPEHEWRSRAGVRRRRHGCVDGLISGIQAAEHAVAAGDPLGRPSMRMWRIFLSFCVVRIGLANLAILLWWRSPLIGCWSRGPRGNP